MAHHRFPPVFGAPKDMPPKKGEQIHSPFFWSIFAIKLGKKRNLGQKYGSGTEKEPKPKLFGPDISGGVGVFHVKGWGPKSSVCPSKPGKSNFLGGISRDFAGISRQCPKSLRKKSLCSILVPYDYSRKNYFLIIFGGSAGKSCKSPGAIT